MNRYYYLDTSIWIDFLEERGENGEHAKRLISKILLKNKKILFSNVVNLELIELGYSKLEINRMLSIIKPNNILKVESTKSDLKLAKIIRHKRNLGLGDILHAILCQKYYVQLVARDRDFERLTDFISAKKPEDLF